MTIKIYVKTREELADKYSKIVCAEKGLTKATQKVLGFLVLRLQREMLLDMAVKDEIALAVGLHHNHVSNCLTELRRAKVLVKNKKYRARYTLSDEFKFAECSTVKFHLIIQKESNK